MTQVPRTWDEAIGNVESAYDAWKGEFAASDADRASFDRECEATIATLRATAPLDVERLAYALNRAFGLQAVGEPLNEIGANPLTAAERLAREYAALEGQT